MADFFLSNLKSTLDNCITELDEIHSMFCRNPESDFTRNRKVSNEILDFFEHSLSAPSKSALPSNDTSFFLKDGISCSTHLSISVVPYRIISIMVTDFWPAMALMLTRPTAISLCRGKRNFMNALHLTQ